MATRATIVNGKANFFKINFRDNIELVQCRVDFQPEVDATFQKKKILSKNEQIIGLGPRYVFDGSSLYTQAQINNEVEGECDGRKYKIILRRTGVVNERDENGLYQTFNLILRTTMGKLNLQNIKRDYFDPAAKIEIRDHNLELWPGYQTSIRQYEAGTLMNCEIIHKFMRKETVYNITRRLMNEDPHNWQENLRREVLGTTVLTDYTNKTYTVDDINFGLNPNSTFTMANGETTSYADYYEAKYGIKIQDRNQFMLISRARERDIRAGHPEMIHLIPELSRATGMTDAMRSNFRLMREVSEFTRLNPANRVQSLNKFNRRLKETPEANKVLQDWEVELSNQLVDIKIREFPQEQIIFGNNALEEANAKSEWSIRGETTMYKTVQCKKWIMLYPKKIERESKNFLRTLMEAAREMNYSIVEPLHKGLETDRQEEYTQIIEEMAPKKPNFVLCILPTNRADRYSALKRLLVNKYGIPSQCIVENRVLKHKNLRSICTKVAIQINCKLGGIPWLIKMPVNGLMAVGFDVSHDPKDRRKSIGAMVATMDVKHSSCFYSVTMNYRDGNEMVDKVDCHMKKAIEIYKDIVGAYPERIVYYRDGVGDSQVQFVKKQEVEPIIKTLTDIYGGNPRFAFVVVNKRTNARFFKKVGNTYINPKPGSIIDSEVTGRGREDFFLISQHVGQGTVAPTYYNIIYNQTGLDLEKMEILTYKLTHLYYNWGGTVRIPAVCQNAKKLAFLTTQSLNGTVANENLIKSLYFL